MDEIKNKKNNGNTTLRYFKVDHLLWTVDIRACGNNHSVGRKKDILYDIHSVSFMG